jgi:hypothetical protein
VPPRVNEREIIVSFVVKRYYNKHADYPVVNDVITFYESEGFVPSKSDSFIPTGVTTITTDDKIFGDPSKDKND